MPQKLKTYTDESQVPPELKDFYAERNGKYEPQVDGVDSVSGLLAKNTELLGKVSGHATEISGKDAEIQRLSGQLANASNSTIPRGHVAVPSAKAALLEQYEPLGTPDELKTIKTEHGTYKAESEATKREKHLRAVARASGYDEEAFIRLPELPEFELRDSDEKDEQGNPKKQAVAKIKGADNVITEKPIKQWLETSEQHKPLLPALLVQKQTNGTPLPSHGAGGGSDSEDIVAKRLKVQESVQIANPNPLMPKTAAA
jgi:hypothetical protein